MLPEFSNESDECKYSDPLFDNKLDPDETTELPPIFPPAVDPPFSNKNPPENSDPPDNNKELPKFESKFEPLSNKIEPPFLILPFPECTRTSPPSALLPALIRESPP